MKLFCLNSLIQCQCATHFVTLQTCFQRFRNRPCLLDQLLIEENDTVKTINQLRINNIMLNNMMFGIVNKTKNPITDLYYNR